MHEIWHFSLHQVVVLILSWSGRPCPRDTDLAFCSMFMLLDTFHTNIARILVSLATAATCGSTWNWRALPSGGWASWRKAVDAKRASISCRPSNPLVGSARDTVDAIQLNVVAEDWAAWDQPRWRASRNNCSCRGGDLCRHWPSVEPRVRLLRCHILVPLHRGHLGIWPRDGLGMPCALAEGILAALRMDLKPMLCWGQLAFVCFYSHLSCTETKTAYCLLNCLRQARRP